MSKDEKTEYVVGFAFDEPGRNVVLILKDHPEWQKGLLNGLGGKVNPGELACEAMAREFREEAGIQTDPLASWDRVAVLKGPDWTLNVYACRLPHEAFHRVRSATKEMVFRCVLPLAHENIVPNCRWLIPLCLDPERKEPVTIERYGNFE